MYNNGFFYGKQFLVLGLARSGYAAAMLLVRLGGKVVVNDHEPLDEDDHAKKLKNLDVEVIGGRHPEDLLEREFDMIVKNPGIPYDNPVVEQAMGKGIPVVTEVEIAGMISRAPFIAITGSNGKTTTTTMIGEMLKQNGKKPLVAGNIGTVVCEVAEKSTSENVIVTELSSFQLLGTKTFHPHVSVLLNLFDAHLDYHGSRENYMKAKARIFANQTAADFAVVNAEDHDVMRLASDSSAQKVFFSVSRQVDKGAYIDSAVVCFAGKHIIDTSEIVLPGKHNLENILAAVAAAKTYGVEDEAIASVLRKFSGVKHRLQYVETVGGRLFYNDSKATNIRAAAKAVAAFNKPVILLAGGLDRGNGFDAFIPALEQVKAVVTFGETAPKIRKASRIANVEKVVTVDHVTEAVPIAYEMSEEDDIILLSPACASWDQHRTFEERGDMFIESVHKLR